MAVSSTADDGRAETSTRTQVVPRVVIAKHAIANRLVMDESLPESTVDEAGWAKFVERHRLYIYKVALRLLRNADESEEATQEVLLRTFRALPQFERRAALTTWLYRITVNTCLNRLAARAREATAFSAAIDPSSDRTDPLERHLTELAVRAAVRSLPSAYREALQLYYFEDRPYREVAHLLGVRVSGLKIRMYRARRALRAQLLLDATGGGSAAQPHPSATRRSRTVRPGG